MASCWLQLCSSRLTPFPIVYPVLCDTACGPMTIFETLFPVLNEIDYSWVLSKLALLCRFSIVWELKVMITKVSSVWSISEEFDFLVSCAATPRAIFFQKVPYNFWVNLLEPQSPTQRNVGCLLWWMFRITFFLMNSSSFVPIFATMCNPWVKSSNVSCNE